VAPGFKNQNMRRVVPRVGPEASTSRPSVRHAWGPGAILANALALPVSGIALGVWISELGLPPGKEVAAWGAIALAVSTARVSRACALGPLGDPGIARYSDSWLPRAQLWRVPLEGALAGLLAGAYPWVTGRVARYRESNPWYITALPSGVVDDATVARVVVLQSAATGLAVAAVAALALFWPTYSWVTLPDVLGEGGPRSPAPQDSQDRTKESPPKKESS